METTLQTEWWYEDSLFQGEQKSLLIAVLYVRQDGTAQIRVEKSVYEFSSLEDARHWLSEDEFNPISDLQELYGFDLNIPSRL